MHGNCTSCLLISLQLFRFVWTLGWAEGPSTCAGVMSTPTSRSSSGASLRCARRSHASACCMQKGVPSVQAIY